MLLRYIKYKLSDSKPRTIAELSKRVKQLEYEYRKFTQSKYNYLEKVKEQFSGIDSEYKSDVNEKRDHMKKTKVKLIDERKKVGLVSNLVVTRNPSKRKYKQLCIRTYELLQINMFDTMQFLKTKERTESNDDFYSKDDNKCKTFL